VIPYSHSVELYKATTKNNNSQLIPIHSAGHNNIESQHYAVIKKYVSMMINEFL
jgi:hypothetical protein